MLHILRIRTNLVKPNIKVKNKHRNMVGSYCESPYNDKWYQSRLFFFLTARVMIATQISLGRAEILTLMLPANED